jgi:hypothetical protein
MTSSQIADFLLVGVAARLPPPRAALTRQGVDALPGPLFSQRKRGPLQPPRPCLFSDPSNLCPSSSEARQRITTEGLGSTPVCLAADHLSCPEIHSDQLAHVVASNPARSSSRPVSGVLQWH